MVFVKVHPGHLKSIINVNFVFSMLSNWGTENDPEFNYHNGNTEPKGFGKNFWLGHFLPESQSEKD